MIDSNRSLSIHSLCILDILYKKTLLCTGILLFARFSRLLKQTWRPPCAVEMHHVPFHKMCMVIMKAMKLFTWCSTLQVKTANALHKTANQRSSAVSAIPLLFFSSLRGACKEILRLLRRRFKIICFFFANFQ